ncbi:hypothetical protein [Thermotalea metallivorans]|uniref:Uncharacterized protein n=1 Tax=Thermotalea metallivorans TaxID=520762 RepID=A0A140L852_9FIRM|nr:hypothetical protein [Thermotalea metallivorans]KXG76727.1 hypothetical protein AN619_08770 [Thermotalea metallivorans]
MDTKKKSPLAGGADWEIQYTIIDPRWQGLKKIVENNIQTRDIQVAKIIDVCKFLTGVQVNLTTYWFGKSNLNLKNRLNYLVRTSYLVKHTIINKKTNYSFPVYTTGIASQEDLNKPYQHNFYTSYTIGQVLKMLSANQFFIKLTHVAHAKIKHNIMLPFTAEVEYVLKREGTPKDREKIKKIKIISVRDYPHDIVEIKRQLPKTEIEENEKVLVICHDEDSLQEISGCIQDQKEKYWLTTDESLFRGELCNAIYTLSQNNCIKKEMIQELQ